MLQRALAIKADYPDALIELANLRAAEGKQAEAVELLQKFVQVGKDPGPGYYKLAMIERTLHRTADAERDLNSFKSFSKAASSGPLPYGHLFDYLDTRSKLPAGAQAQLDLADLQSEVARHPDRIEPLYMLTEAYLKAGSLDDARKTLAQLDPLAAGDFRTFTGIGVLLARYRYFDGAIAHFKAALDANPNSEEVRFDLANAYFRKRLFPDALHTLEPVSADCNKDDACLSLMGDIYAHMGDSDRAATIYREAIQRNPDNDQDYLSLAMLQLKDQKIADARKTLAAGQARIPASGKLSWGLGLASVLDGDTTKATSEFERAVDLLPEWPGSYSILGVFYFETGQVSKAREVLSRFKGSSASGSLDIGRIEQTLDQAPETRPAPDAPMAQENRAQLLQFALSLADRTL
jgi:tetratricopeptide (TPR) repeat protein